jgi:Protein of unknown function (DUF2892)
MKKNMGIIDRSVRILLAIIMVTLYFFHSVTGTFGLVILILAFIFLLTSLFNFCPLYAIFGFSTCKKEFH